MSQRERLLAIGTSGLAVLLAIFFGWSQIRAMFESRRTALENVEQQVSQQTEQLEREQRRQRDLQDVLATMIAADNDQAVNNYKNWLLRAVNESGFESPNVNPPHPGSRSTLFQEVVFTAKGRADLEQFSRFLVKFYATAEQHQMRYVKLTPIANSRLLDVDLTIHVLMGKGSKRVGVSEEQRPEADRELLRQMASTMVNRNCFSELNVAPTWKDVAAQSFPRGEPIEIALGASDGNPIDKLSYRMVEGPEGAKIDAATGTFRWQPDNNGEHTVRVAVADDGLPRQTSELTFKLAIVDPAPQQARTTFDHAAQAFLVATILNEPDSEVWVHLRTTGKTLKLKLGDTLKVGSVEGEITHIGPRDIHLKAEAGRLRLPLGAALTAAQPIESPVAATAAESAAATDPSSASDEG